MPRRNLVLCLAVVFGVVLEGAYIKEARAAGYWNMPGTHAQRTGHGYGGGYHAPLMLGPVRCDGWGLGNQVRLPYSPTPYYGCGGCGDCGRMVEATSSIESVVPTTAPAPVPMPAAAAPMETRTVDPTPAAASDSAALDAEPVVEPTVEPFVESERPLFDPPVQP
jgi:hypothetical protein